MEDTFLINIDCSKILVGSSATQYTMFIDSSKMSIVYELVEWIRWMFSLESCIYLTHQGSVIHELEDIQLLSKLKNFEILPCGQPHCAHKKSYRTLLKSLNLILSWNDMEVHKYFLDKINQMSQKITQKVTTNHLPVANDKVYQDLISFNIEKENENLISKENNSYLSENDKSETYLRELSAKKDMQIIDMDSKSTTYGESPSKIDFTLSKKSTENINFLLQPEKNVHIEHKSNIKYCEIKKNHNKILKNTSSLISPIKGECKVNSDTVVNSTKHKARNKCTKPFSLGEILSNLREDFEKKIKDPPIFTANNSESFTEGSFNIKNAEENSLLMLDNPISEKKRQRTRKRKRSKRQSIEDKDFTYALENKKAVCSFNIYKPDCNIKPNHIRFDADADDYQVNLENGEEQNKNKLEMTPREINNTSPSQILKIESEEIKFNESENLAQRSVPERNTADELGSSPVSVNQMAGDEKLTSLQNETSENMSQSFNSPSKFDSVALNNDLTNLLSQRDRFKGIVIQRYY